MSLPLLTMRIFPATSLLPLLLLALAPAAAKAAGFDAVLRAGVAAPRSSAVTLGPSVGLGARLTLPTRYRIVATADQSAHGLAQNANARIDATTLALGLEVVLDELPIVPTFALGPAVQYASRHDRDLSVWVPAAFAGLGLQAALPGGLRIGVQLRYLSTDFSAEGFPAFPAFALELGWGLGG